MKTNYIIWGVVAVLAVAGIFYYARTINTVEGDFDSFAQCLASKEITMYGAVWCPWCKKEKEAFGKSFQYVPYVECPDNPQQCLSKGVESYPTWIWPDGKKLTGYQGLEKLSRESGCALGSTR